MVGAPLVHERALAVRVNAGVRGPALVVCYVLQDLVRDVMSDKKVIFVAFAIEDERQRDFLKGQSLHSRAPYEFVDMSVKEPYKSDWKDRVRTRIRRSHGVIVLASKNSLSSSGQKWEIRCAKDEGKPIRGIWAYQDDRTPSQQFPPSCGATPTSAASSTHFDPCVKH